MPDRHAYIHPASPELLALLERSAGAGCWAQDLTTGKWAWTEALFSLLELKPGQDEPADLLAFAAPESGGTLRAALLACRRDAQPFNLELQALTATGRRLWLRASGQAVRGTQGEVLGLQGVLLDLSEQKQIQQESLRVLMQLSTTLASINEAFATLDLEGRFTYLNSESERILGRKSAQLLGRCIWDEMDESGGGRVRLELKRALETGLNAEFEAFYPPQQRWLELRAYLFAEGLAVYMRDVTERRRSQKQLQLLQTSISRLNDIVLIADAGDKGDGEPRIVFVNDAFQRLTGYTDAEVMGRTPRLLLGPLTQHTELERIRAALCASRPVRAELTVYKKNGTQFWLELEIVPVEHGEGGLTHWVAVGRDITARKAADDEIEHLAFYDTLTELPNRQLLMERLASAVSRSSASKGLGALMFIDLDHFKVLNDTLGHARGDLLLQKVATRLSACVRRHDTVARLGGDEFVVMLEDLAYDAPTALAKTRVVGQKILTALSEPYDLSGHQHHGTCSVGVTQFQAGQGSIGDLLKQADLAMYQAKATGRNALCFFDPAMQAAATANAALNTELRHALHEQQFVLHYQPQVGRDDRMVGVEALLRWQRQNRLAMPDEFVAQAEESGLIMPLGAWVLETACTQIAAWAKRPETASFSVAVNVSVRQFRHPEFVDQVMSAIQRTGIPPQRLKLELTESLLASDIDVTIAKMGMLKEAGVTLSIDDFGMGYSALSYLKHMPLDQLKIDRTFVKDVLTDPNDAAIARTIIGLAQSLGLAVMAEGVETQAQRDFLMRHGCECYQGFLFCKPLPIEALEPFIAAHLQVRSPAGSAQHAA
jgi:diguanylate cyclase (GGDEF)-like protein/PAS domain S-box-containing protein